LEDSCQRSVGSFAQVPLKVNQCFVQTGDGNYKEWNPSQNGDNMHALDTPVLQSTFIKVGM